METKKHFTTALVITALLASQGAWADAQDRRQAKRIHDRLTGVTATNDVINAMEATMDSSLTPPPGYSYDPTGANAARYAIDTTQHNANAANPNARYFYNVTLKNFVTPWTNEAQTVFAPLNDYTATAIGLIRDEADFRTILHGNVTYYAPSVNPGVAANNNDHYEAIETLGPVAGDMSDNGFLVGTTQSSLPPNLPSTATAGVMTSRAAAMAFYSDGTNRAMFRFTLMNHLCTDLEPLKDISRTPDRVRRDVSRSPGGDSRIFLNSCVGCHAGMDGMSGAFAYYEWDHPDDIAQGQLRYRAIGNPLFDANGVSIKHNRAPNTFEYGYETVDDSWINYWRNGPNSVLGNRPGDVDDGWGGVGGGEVSTLDAKNNAIGNGAAELGIELANSKAFAYCQVDKVFQAVCLRDPNLSSTDRAARDGMVSSFVSGGFNLRDVFVDTAAYCKGS